MDIPSAFFVLGNLIMLVTAGVYMGKIMRWQYDAVLLTRGNSDASHIPDVLPKQL